jgi:hypothetical protein
VCKYCAMEIYEGMEVYVPHMLNLSTRWRWMVSFMPWLLYSLDRRLGDPQSQSDCSGEEKISIPCGVLHATQYSRCQNELSLKICKVRSM